MTERTRRFWDRVQTALARRIAGKTWWRVVPDGYWMVAAPQVRAKVRWDGSMAGAVIFGSSCGVRIARDGVWTDLGEPDRPIPAELGGDMS